MDMLSGPQIAEAAVTWPAGAWEDSTLMSVWLDTADRPPARACLGGDVTVDLLVVGGGFTGLWTALRALERGQAETVLVIEADRIAEHATGRNGGFCEASITHGESNGRTRWPEEFDRLHDLGMRNLDEIEATVAAYGIDCGFARGGALTVATRPHEVDALEPGEPGFLDREAVRRVVDSPTYLAGRHHPGENAVLDPARLAWGLADAVESRGGRLAEGTRLTGLRRGPGSVQAETSHGTVTATHVVLATNVFRTPLRRTRWSVVPVYDYVLATEPLTDEQLAALRWDPAIGVSDSGNQFHYYRVTPDRRILWGGYDAVYHFGRSIKTEHEDRPETFEALAQHFAETFPQLDGIRFSHRWSGVIDTSTRFCAMFGTSHGGRAAYATGFTGLGVGASRFAADVMLDLLAGTPTERTRLEMVRKRPLPFPPEPFAWIGIQLTRWALAREDRTGRRHLWLRLLDRFGLGVRLVSTTRADERLVVADVHSVDVVADGGSSQLATASLTLVERPAGAVGEVGVWEAGPGRDTDVEVDETFLVLSGAGRVVFDDDSHIDLAPGVLVRLRAGDRTTWVVTERLRKLYVL